MFSFVAGMQKLYDIKKEAVRQELIFFKGHMYELV